MNNPDPTDAQVAAAPWADLFEAMAGFSDTAFLQSIQEDLIGIRTWTSVLRWFGTSPFQRRQ
jgi:hypothetical protein